MHILQCEPGFSAMKFIKTDLTTKLEVENVFRDALSITEPKMSYSFNTIKRLLLIAKMTQPFMRG